MQCLIRIETSRTSLRRMQVKWKKNQRNRKKVRKRERRRWI
jgi:hypothetical protein